MYGNNKTICIAGKNSCAIEALKFVIRNFELKDSNNSLVLTLNMAFIVYRMPKDD